MPWNTWRNFSKPLWHLIFIGPCIVIYATVVQPKGCNCYFKLFIIVKRSTRFGRSFCPSSGAQNCVYNNDMCQTAAAIKDEMELRSILSLITAGSSSCLTHIVAVYAVSSSWWWKERPSETCRAFYKNK